MKITKNIFMTLLDLCKIFETIRRYQIIKDLSKILDDDELYMFYLLMYKIQYTVQVGNVSWLC